MTPCASAVVMVLLHNVEDNRKCADFLLLHFSILRFAKVMLQIPPTPKSGFQYIGCKQTAPIHAEVLFPRISGEMDETGRLVTRCFPSRANG